MIGRINNIKCIIEKMDNGYEGSIVDWDHPDLVTTFGTNIQNRHLKPFPKGTLVYAVFDITPAGRRMLKKVWEKKSPIEETTILNHRLSPIADSKGWMNTRETERFRATGARKGEPIKVNEVAPTSVEEAARKGMTVEAASVVEAVLGREAVEAGITKEMVIDDLMERERRHKDNSYLEPVTAQSGRAYKEMADKVAAATGQTIEDVHRKIEAMAKEGVTPGVPASPAPTTFTPSITITAPSGRKAVFTTPSGRETTVEEFLSQTVTVPEPVEVEPVIVKRVDAPILKGYHVDQEARLTFTTAYNMSVARPERAVKVMMVGPSGYGKTMLPWLLSQVTGLDFYYMNCGSVRDPEEWFGYREALDGSTVFIRSQLMSRLERGNVVVVLDEFNRLEPWLHNTLFPLLDDTGATRVHDEEFKVGPGVIVVATINTGYRYTGTFELDEALFNRFDFTLEVGPLAQADEVRVLVERTGIKEADAKIIAKTATKLRQAGIICSTRTTLGIAFKQRAGMGLRAAFEASVVKRIPVEADSGAGLRKQAIDLLNVDLGYYKTELEMEDIFQVNEVEKVSKKKAVSAVEELVLKQPVLEITTESGRELHLITTIKGLRLLPISIDPERPFMSLKEAKDMAESIQAGNGAVVTLATTPSNLDGIVSELRRSGAHVNITLK